MRYRIYKLASYFTCPNFINGNEQFSRILNDERYKRQCMSSQKREARKIFWGSPAVAAAAGRERSRRRLDEPAVRPGPAPRPRGAGRLAGRRPRRRAPPPRAAAHGVSAPPLLAAAPRRATAARGARLPDRDVLLGHGEDDTDDAGRRLFALASRVPIGAADRYAVLSAPSAVDAST